MYPKSGNDRDPRVEDLVKLWGSSEAKWLLVLAGALGSLMLPGRLGVPAGRIRTGLLIGWTQPVIVRLQHFSNSCKSSLHSHCAAVHQVGRLGNVPAKCWEYVSSTVLLVLIGQAT